MPAVHAGTGADIYNVIRTAHGIFVMFDNNKSIAEVTESFQRCKQAVIITLMQPYARFIQNIENADKARAYLSCKPNALCLSSGKA